MKKLTALFCTVLVIFSLSTNALAANPTVDVTINGTKIEFDVPAQIINNRTMVPMRKIFETLNASVQWVPEERGIIAISGTKIITMVIDKPRIMIADIAAQTEVMVELDVAPQIVNDRTLVPVRAVSEALGVQVDWDNATRTVILH